MKNQISFMKSKFIQPTTTVGVAILLVSITTSSSAQHLDPQKVVGREACGKCHASELKAWSASSHATVSWELLSDPKAADFAKALGIADPKAAGSTCVQCHGTPSATEVAHGNSCESCHGTAGGSDGYLKIHSDFGEGGTNFAELLTQRKSESDEHYDTRMAACKKAGMNESTNVFAIARNCLTCHTVPNAELVAAKHPTTEKFEFVEWSQGEVRHNFLLDQSTNAESPSGWLDRGDGRTVEGRKSLAFIAGQLADLEVSLRNRAGVDSVKRNSLGDLANERIADAIKELSRMKSDEIDAILELLGAIDDDSVEELTGDDESLYTGAADKIKAAAEDFVQKHRDGNDLPEVKIPSKAKGDALTP